MLLNIHPKNPDQRKIFQVVDALKEGKVMIYPTDTVYGLGCDIYNTKAVERICQIRGLDPKKAQLSFICKDISQIAEFAQQIDNDTFKILKKNLPGHFTFVLKANKKVPKLLKNKRDEIGVRIPNSPIVQALLDTLDGPILSASLKGDDEISTYFTDPLDIHDDFKNLVDVVIDGGIGQNTPSTVVDLTGDEPVMLREGAGDLQ